jgi:hypothetical protein
MARSAWPIMERLRTCLCTQFESDMDCFCGTLPGAQAVDWWGTGGQVWVRLVEAYQSSNFPIADPIPSATAPLAYRLEVGALRCGPEWPESTTPPDAATMTAFAGEQVSDMMAMHRAIWCCMQDEDDFILGNYTPISSGPNLGGMWTLVVRNL